MADALAGLQLAFALAEVDLEAIDQRRTDALKRAVFRFLQRAPGGQPGADTGGVWVGSELPPELSDRDLQELHVAVNHLLWAAAARVPLSDHDLRMLTVSDLAIAPTVTASGEVIVRVATGSLRDRYLLALLLLLAHVGAGRVLRCRCGRPFLKLGRRTSCPDAQCRAERRANYWQRWKRSPSGRKALKRIYDANCWTLGARTGRRSSQK